MDCRREPHGDANRKNPVRAQEHAAAATRTREPADRRRHTARPTVFVGGDGTVGRARRRSRAGPR